MKMSTVIIRVMLCLRLMMGQIQLRVYSQRHCCALQGTQTPARSSACVWCKQPWGGNCCCMQLRHIKACKSYTVCQGYFNHILIISLACMLCTRYVKFLIVQFRSFFHLNQDLLSGGLYISILVRFFFFYYNVSGGITLLRRWQNVIVSKQVF